MTSIDTIGENIRQKMDESHSLLLENRSFILISGEDRIEFLQGLISNDVRKCENKKAIWAAILTPQGKFLYDFFVFQREEQLVIECEDGDLMALGQLLRKYQLRSKITFAIDRESKVLLVWGKQPVGIELGNERGALIEQEGAVIYADPRHAEIGLRIVASKDKLIEIQSEFALENTPLNDYEANRISYCIPNGMKDIEPAKGLLLEYGFDELESVDWDKGCYMGQELTARTKYRALIKKRLLPIMPATGEWDRLPEYGEKILSGGKEIGEVRSVSERNALAFIRLDRWKSAMDQDEVLLLNEREINVCKPDWVKLNENFISLK